MKYSLIEVSMAILLFFMRRKYIRLTYDQMNGLKRQFGVDRIWSYSRLSTYVEQPFVYRMTYLDPAKVRTSNIYSYFGTICHDIIQDAVEGKTKREDMIGIFEEKVLELQLDPNSMKFMSENVEGGYLDNLKEYFTNTSLIDYEVENEKPVCVQFKRPDGGNIIFVGYMDTLYSDGEKWYIMDYKTSSKGDYTGKRLKAHSRQLQLYAIGLHQIKGIPYEDIVLRFDMMKYYKVSYLQKNGKWKDSIQERATWVSTQEKKIRTILLENDINPFDIDQMVGQANVDNNLESLPEYVQEKFRISNCYIDTEINSEIEKDIESFVIENILECERKEQGDIEEEFPEPAIDDSNSFYFHNLAPQIIPYLKNYKASTDYKRNKDSYEESELEALFK